MTAHDVVARVRRFARIKQVGHAGTLDPMARGVLPIALGRATRLLRFLQDDKVYKAAILFGQCTDTDDIEGKVLATSEAIPSEIEIAAALPKFTGEIEQKPPIYSAIHIDGERLYNLARRGEVPAEIPSRRVTVHSIEALGFSGKTLELRIHCSSGTYIRSIARDLGHALGTYACLSALERERHGPFGLAEANSLEKIESASSNSSLADLFLAVEGKIDLPAVELDDDQFRRLGFGQRVRLPFVGTTPCFARLEQESNLKSDLNSEHESDSKEEGQYAMAMHNGKLAAVCLVLPADEKQMLSDSSSRIVELKPEVVLFDGSAK